MNRCLLLLFLFISLSSGAQAPFVLVLGTAQDGGYPQADCNKNCCKKVWADVSKKQFVSCLALVNAATNEAWLFDATPDFADQLQLLKTKTNDSIKLAGIFLTHAHMGHYTGLMHLGREAMNAKKIPVFAMPRMKKFLAENGPWSQLVALGNISTQLLENGKAAKLNEELSVTPMLVPHRDEFSETVGYLIQAKTKSVLFIPDIDKWEMWDKNISTEVRKADYAFLDATFYSATELPGRNLKEIPHPLVEESMQLFSTMPATEKSKIHFIHFNHSNPLLDKKLNEKSTVLKAGFNLAEQGKIYLLE